MTNFYAENCFILMIFTRIMSELFIYMAEVLKVVVSRQPNYCRDTVLGFKLYLYTEETYVWINKFIRLNLLISRT
jgi:hypothetical protein